MRQLKLILESTEWIGVDFDGTLAHYDTYKGAGVLGAPVQKMVDRVKKWLANGETVKVLTARAARNNKNRQKEITAIKAWTKKHLGQELEVTAEKDRYMSAIWDDNAFRIVKNTGEHGESVVHQLRTMKEAAAVVDVKMVMNMARHVIPKSEIEKRLKKYLDAFEDEIDNLLNSDTKVVHYGIGIH